MAGGDVQRRGELPLAAGGAVLGVAVLVFAVEQISIASVNGWWLDELYSIWSTDPRLTFVKAFLTRFGHDHTPPLYYAALFWVRRLVGVPAGQERIWGYIISVCCILLACAAVVGVSRRAGLTGFALAGMGAFLLSGPVLQYAPEVRAYLMAMAIVFVASWCAALAIERAARPLHVIGWAVFGILAAATHLYAALWCGGLAAGLLVLAAFGGRRDLMVPGLALGLSASGSYGAWAFVTSAPKYWAENPWFTFTLKNIIHAAGHVRQLEIGGNIAFALLIALCAWALVHRSTRALATAFGTGFAVFYLVPIAVSFKTPIVIDRYWMVGGPALVVLLLFLGREWLWEGIDNRSQGNRALTAPLAMGLGTVALLIASSATGFTYARARTANKFIWRGGEIVSPLAGKCPASSIHVLSTGDATQYAQVAQLPTELFVASNAPVTASPTARGSCPVLGWAEHYFDYGPYMASATDEDLLRVLKIDASPSEVEIRRLRSGYVVLRRGAYGPAPATPRP